MIVGIVVGVVCAVLIGIEIAIFVIRYKKKKATKEEAENGLDKKSGSTKDIIGAGKVQSAQGLNV